MAVIYVLLPVAILLAVTFVVLFVWATRDGQFDDVNTPRYRVLFEDDSESGPDRPGRPSPRTERERS